MTMMESIVPCVKQNNGIYPVFHENKHLNFMKVVYKLKK